VSKRLLHRSKTPVSEIRDGLRALPVICTEPMACQERGA
jgi:hypothetical protein